MALEAGIRLGPYEILEPLGAGGMGEVYRAKDTRLDRTVAVKVLPSDVAADPALKARFEREPRAISALAHPNICTLYDVGEESGQTFLVMEHLVGQTELSRCCHPVGQDLRWEAICLYGREFPGDLMDDKAAAERRPDELCRRRTQRWPAGRLGSG